MRGIASPERTVRFAAGGPAFTGHTGMAGIRGFAAPALAGCAFGWRANRNARKRADTGGVRGFTARDRPTPSGTTPRAAWTGHAGAADGRW
jgi:hypothetical protein